MKYNALFLSVIIYLTSFRSAAKSEQGKVPAEGKAYFGLSFVPILDAFALMDTQDKNVTRSLSCTIYVHSQFSLRTNERKR